MSVVVILVLIMSSGAYAELEDYYIPYGEELFGISQTEKYQFLEENNNYLYHLKNGLYFSKEMAETDVLKYIEFLITNIPELEEKYSNPTEKYFIKSGDDADFVFLGDNKQYNVDLKSIDIAMKVQGSFFEYGTVNIIDIEDLKDKEQFFATFMHENLHVLQQSKYQSTMYNIFDIDVKELSLKDLRANLEWIDHELEAHYETAELIGKIINQPDERKEYILSYLGLTEEGLIREKQKEMNKYSLYEQEEKRIINEIIRKNS